MDYISQMLLYGGGISRYDPTAGELSVYSDSIPLVTFVTPGLIPTGQISIVCVAAGGVSQSGYAGGGGGLSWVNNYPISVGDELGLYPPETVHQLNFPGPIRDAYVTVNGVVVCRATAGTVDGTKSPTANVVAQGGGRGGAGGSRNTSDVPLDGGGNGSAGGGGGGAGGYTGDGGDGANGSFPLGTGGAGGGGGGGCNSAGGGGVSLVGQGPSGLGGNASATIFPSAPNIAAGTGGSYGFNGSAEGWGGRFGGGSVAYPGSVTLDIGGGVRVIWGNNRLFPNTNTGIDMYQ